MTDNPFTIRSSKPTKDQVKAIEQGDDFAPLFDDRGLIPVSTTCADTGVLLMQAWMNSEAIRATLTTGQAHYFSRSRQQLWHKGATSGEIQDVVELRTDCDQDSLWLRVHQHGGGCCHVGYASCFYRTVKHDENGAIRLEKNSVKSQ